ncbi:MAG: hypothetical protein ABSE99_15255 [Terracidiphilus sp.]|jgi:hypothetical protein
MNGFLQSATTVTQTSHDRADGSRQPADLVYQTVTIAAMLLLLGSLWVF